MTVLVGILCDDGVVIGADSAETLVHGAAFTTIEIPGAVKIQIIGSSVITATSGSVGLAQRFNKIMLALNNGGDLRMADVIEQGTFISEKIINDFRRTISARQQQPQNGWGIGALVALPLNAKPELFEFDPIQFHPERRGDPGQDGKDRTSRIVSMGSGQVIADPFLGFIRNLFWTSDKPKLKDAKVAVAWTLKHVISLNPGGVGGPQQLAVLEKIEGSWKASEIDSGEIGEQVDDLEDHIGKYRQTILDKIETPVEQVPKR